MILADPVHNGGVVGLGLGVEGCLSTFSFPLYYTL